MRLPRINTAAMLVIGDEVLNGKIKDTNSQFFSQYCFELGINLRRITVVPDERKDIAEELNRLRSKYDFIVTTGGIGPTHDDITYESIAEAFGLSLALDKETVAKMEALAANPPSNKVFGSPEYNAQLRMATFPFGSNVERLFVCPKLWVPIVALNHQVYIFPGIPALYRAMIEGLRPLISNRVDAPKLTRRYVQTLEPESVLAPILSEIHAKYEAQGVKIGSYPHFHDKRNTVSILGPENSSALDEIVAQLLPRISGTEVTPEEEALAG